MRGFHQRVQVVIVLHRKTLLLLEQAPRAASRCQGSDSSRSTPGFHREAPWLSPRHKLFEFPRGTQESAVMAVALDAHLLRDAALRLTLQSFDASASSDQMLVVREEQHLRRALSSLSTSNVATARSSSNCQGDHQQ